MTPSNHIDGGADAARSRLSPAMIVVAPARYMLIDAAAVALGTTAKAIRMKIERAVWVENKQFRRAPDGRIWVDMQGVEKWVEAGPA